MDGTYDFIVQLAKKGAEKKAEQIKKKVEKEAPMKAGKRLEKEIPKYVENAMNQFYLAYNPDVYVRLKYGLGAGVRDGIKTTLSQNYLTITVTSDHIPDHKHDSGEYIFMGGFERGIHGTSAICVSTPPWMLYMEDIEERYSELFREEAEKIINKMLKGR